MESVRGIPQFDTVTSVPIEDSSSYHLKLCFCPLCQVGIEVLQSKASKGIISWQYICRVVLFCLSVKHKPQTYFSLKNDMMWFISDHWYIFKNLKQFNCSPNKWKKAFLDSLSHSAYFESGTQTLKHSGYWKLTNIASPWNDRIDYFNTNPVNQFRCCNTPLSTSTSVTNTLDYTNLNRISELVYKAKSNFSNFLNSLQNKVIENENAINNEKDLELLHQYNQVNSIILKTDKILNSLNLLLSNQFNVDDNDMNNDVLETGFK